jgi:GT2 family glycosyltransferase
MPSGLISILITTHNSAAVLRACLDSLAQQDHFPVEVIVVDNASDDGTRAILKPFESQHRIIYNETNNGYAGSQNQAMRYAQGEWILSLNPDVILSRSFLTETIAAAENHPRVGAVCGKLLRWNPGGKPEYTQVLDSTGIYFMRNLRHLDRGAEEIDRGQYDKPAYVFGATGAAVLYRRRMIEDVSLAGEFYDEDFFAYREDADVAWRAQLMGWQCLYTPRAVGWHVRRVTPSRLREQPDVIKWHCLKNRFLMRAKNISLPLYLRLLLPVTWRDCLILGYSLLCDRKLLSAFSYLWVRRQAIRQKRQWVQAHRRVSDKELARWFSNRPTEGSGIKALT